jgi:hypothetical protein
LIDTELVEILSKSYDCSSSSSNFSDSDNKINDLQLAVVDAIINDDTDGEEVTYKTFLLETMDNYSAQKEVFHFESGPRNKARNVTHNLECFELSSLTDNTAHSGRNKQICRKQKSKG